MYILGGGGVQQNSFTAERYCPHQTKRQKIKVQHLPQRVHPDWSRASATPPQKSLVMTLKDSKSSRCLPAEARTPCVPPSHYLHAATACQLPASVTHECLSFFWPPLCWLPAGYYSAVTYNKHKDPSCCVSCLATWPSRCPPHRSSELCLPSHTYTCTTFLSTQPPHPLPHKPPPPPPGAAWAPRP
jgi:hypothetical protein